MRWKGSRRSSNIEDRRGQRRGGLVGGGVGTIVLILVALYFGVDPSFLIDGMASGGSSAPTAPDPRENELAEMVAVVVADTEDAWHQIFNENGQQYREPTLVLFTGATRSACGTGQAAMGPFYCPADQKAYIDLSFYEQMRSQLGAPGDFAQAYVIAHEIGHHVQNLLGTSGEVHRARQSVSQAEGNRLSVMLELQADCYAGVWANRANRARNLIEDGDIEEALNAASSIGDDVLQQRGGGAVVPERFTHGTAEQRRRWFQIGIATGDPGECNTFAADSL